MKYFAVCTPLSQKNWRFCSWLCEKWSMSKVTVKKLPLPSLIITALFQMPVFLTWDSFMLFQGCFFFCKSLRILEKNIHQHGQNLPQRTCFYSFPSNIPQYHLSARLELKNKGDRSMWSVDGASDVTMGKAGQLCHMAYFYSLRYHPWQLLEYILLLT